MRSKKLLVASVFFALALGFGGSLALPRAVFAEDAVVDAAEDTVEEAPVATNMYRLYNPNSGEHFYTASLDEVKNVVEAGWRYEGVGWVAPTSSNTPVYRLYNPNAGDHHYTVSVNERDGLVALGWRYEGIGWYSDDEQSVALLRLYNPNAQAGGHNFTTSGDERSTLTDAGWSDEGVGWYGLDSGVLPIKGRWLVTSAWGSLERYWLGSDAVIAKRRLVTPDEGAGYYAYATDDGSILRGTAKVGGVTYTATNDGALTFPLCTTVQSGDATAHVTTSFVDGATYLFLPAYADLSSVSLSIDGVGSSLALEVSLDGGTSWVAASAENPLDLSGVSESDGARTLLYRVAGTDSAQKLVVMVSANVRAMYLTSDDAANKGREWVEASSDHSRKAAGSMLLVDPDGSVVYDDALKQIKGRGNSTWLYSSKKPYQIKLDSKADLLETGDSANKAKTWVLLANATDATLLHNTLAYKLALAPGLESSPECAPVDLYYDGEYRGSYLLCEKVEVASGRVDIYDLEGANEDANPDADPEDLPVATATNKYGQTFQYVEGMTNPADISGGYLVEFDYAYYASERCWFQTSVGYFVLKSPENCSYEQMKYISEYVQEVVDACNAQSTNALTGASLADLVDVQSFAQVYAVNEFTKNIDYCASSAYLYLPSATDESGLEHKLYAGPVWDFDTSFGVRNENPTDLDPNKVMFGESYRVWYMTGGVIDEAARKIMAGEMVDLAEALMGSGTDALPSFDSLASEIKASQRMNYALWDLESFANCRDPFATYEQNVEYLRNWMGQRIAWAKGYYG